MASKFGLAGGIPERRVRQIWDAVDSRQYKNALKLSSALLTKYPNSPYALALKAVILERMGKPEEALSTCLEAKELLHTTDTFMMDDLTLSTMQIVFQRLDRLDLATSCYEYACGKFPSHLELMMGLFNCYVREYSYVKQQQIALKMYKIVGEERFLLWAICSIQLQVCHGHGGEKLLALAEGLLKKHITSHSLHEPEALMIYLCVLERQGKYRDAVEILSGKLGGLLTIEVDRLQLQGGLLARAGDHSAAASTFKKILELRPDDWECFLQYLGCLLEDDLSWCKGLISEVVHPPKSVVNSTHVTVDMLDSRMSEAIELVQKLQAETCGDPTRGPDLANLEIERRKHLHGIGDKKKLCVALMQYFYRFGHLSSFCSDVEVFLEVLNTDEKTDLLEELRNGSSSLSVQPIKSLGHALTLQKIQELIGDNYGLSNSELEQSAVKMLNMYCKNLHLSKNLDPQENMHGEELLSVASNMLVQLFWRTKHHEYLLEAVMVLELGLAIRSHVWHYKISLIHLCPLLGAFPVAYEWYRTLDVKNILLESATHHILPQLLASPLWGDLDVILKDYLKFMDDHFRESADLTFLAYRHRNYSKVIEFVQFKERLQHSNQYLVAKIELCLLHLKKAENIEEAESVLENMSQGTVALELASDTACNSLTFNEDLQTRPWWTPAPDMNYLLGPFDQLPCLTREKLLECRKGWELNVKKTIDKRSLLPRMIYLSLWSAAASTKEAIEVNGSTGDQHFSLELKSLLEKYARVLGVSLKEAVEVLDEISKGQRSLEAFGPDTMDWVNLAVFLNALSLRWKNHGLPLEGEGRSAWHMTNSILETAIMQKVTTTVNMLDCSLQGNVPILVQLLSEPLAWHILVIQSCVRLSLPCGKKKKKGGATEQSISSPQNSIQNSIQALCRVLDAVTKWLKEQIGRTEDEALDTLISSLSKGSGAGQVFRILNNIAFDIDEAELGDRTVQALKSWNPAETARKTVSGQRRMLSDLLRICESKLKSLETLRVRM